MSDQAQQFGCGRLHLSPAQRANLGPQLASGELQLATRNSQLATGNLRLATCDFHPRGQSLAWRPQKRPGLTLGRPQTGGQLEANWRPSYSPVWPLAFAPCEKRLGILLWNLLLFSGFERVFLSSGFQRLVSSGGVELLCMFGWS